MSKKKEDVKVFENLKGVSDFLLVCNFSLVFCVGIVSILFSRRIQYTMAILIVTACATSWGTIMGLIIKEEEDEKFQKIKFFFNPFSRKTIDHMFVLGMLALITTIPINLFFLHIEWEICIVTTLLMAWGASWIAYAASPIWNS